MRRLCALAQVSRAGFYRWRHAPPAEDADLDLRDEIRKIVLEWPSYGWRRAAPAELEGKPQAEARGSSIERFIEKVYNRKHLHSALGFCSPAEFERGRLAGVAAAGLPS